MIIVGTVLPAYIKNRFLLGVIIFVLLVGQLRLIILTNGGGANLTLVQKGMLLRHEKAAVQYIANYKANEPSGVTAFTNPYNVNTVWAYVFSVYWPKDQPMPVWVTNFATGFNGEKIFSE